MKIKFFLALFLSICFYTNIVIGADDIDWSKDSKYKLNKIEDVILEKAFLKGTEIPAKGGMQSATLTDKYLVFCSWTSNTDKTSIIVADKETYKVLSTNSEYCFDHCNCMTYNSITDEVLIVTYNKKIAKFQINNEHKIENVQTVDVARTYSAITYDYDDDIYICYSGNKMYILNNKFEEISEFNSPTRYLVAQGIGYFNNYIYFCCHESGKENTYQTTRYNSKEAGSNLIYVYNVHTGEFIKSIYIPNTIVKGEIESITFFPDGKPLYGYARTSILHIKL